MRRMLLYGVWLAVVVVALVLTIVRFRSHGIWGPVAIVLGVGMLVLFAVDCVFAGKDRGGIRANVGGLTTLIIIAAVTLGLWVSVAMSVVRGNWLPAIVFAVFGLSFARILKDYLGHLRKEWVSREQARQEDTDGTA